ncbi:MAG: hypothetical protein KGL39_44360 [Patescibacteria group bacterium]|nr:hypothetical protein [Patescibacteria group bacterium]
MTKLEKTIEAATNPYVVGAVVTCGMVIGLEAGGWLGSFLIAAAVITGLLYQEAFVDYTDAEIKEKANIDGYDSYPD